MDTYTRVLVVDDNDDAVFTMCAVLESMKWFHTIVGRNNASFCGIDLGTFDLLLTDFNMRTGANGIRLARSFKILNPEGYCILISGMHGIKLSADVDQFFMKPICLDAFRNCLIDWLTKENRLPVRPSVRIGLHPFELEVSHD